MIDRYLVKNKIIFPKALQTEHCEVNGFNKLKKFLMKHNENYRYAERK